MVDRTRLSRSRSPNVVGIAWALWRTFCGSDLVWISVGAQAPDKRTAQSSMHKRLVSCAQGLDHRKGQITRRGRVK